MHGFLLIIVSFTDAAIEKFPIMKKTDLGVAINRALPNYRCSHSNDSPTVDMTVETEVIDTNSEHLSD